jgi:23S rRNA pseudouridine2605 synthase
MPDNEVARLNKHLALQLGVSRREADEMIQAGRVVVNDAPATLGHRIASTDTITVDGQPLGVARDLQYVVLNKPIGYVSSRRKQGDNETIYALLPPELHHLKPVGRLDKDSSGLILLTNDGDFAHQMTHPKFYKIKTYKVRLDHDLEPLHQQMISDYGVTLEDGPSKLRLERISEDSRKEWTVTMHEGRNRQIRRTFAVLGYDVKRLHRTNFGNYSIGDMKPGDYIILDTHPMV